MSLTSGFDTLPDNLPRLFDASFGRLGSKRLATDVGSALGSDLAGVGLEVGSQVLGKGGEEDVDTDIPFVRGGSFLLVGLGLISLGGTHGGQDGGGGFANF